MRTEMHLSLTVGPLDAIPIVFGKHLGKLIQELWDRVVARSDRERHHHGRLTRPMLLLSGGQPQQRRHRQRRQRLRPRS